MFGTTTLGPLRFHHQQPERRPVLRSSELGHGPRMPSEGNGSRDVQQIDENTDSGFSRIIKAICKFLKNIFWDCCCAGMDSAEIDLDRRPLNPNRAGSRHVTDKTNRESPF